jgi:hypothetical protein
MKNEWKRTSECRKNCSPDGNRRDTPQRLASYIHFVLRHSFHPPLAGFPGRDEVFDFPQPIRHASSHRSSDAQCALDLDEIVREVAERDRRTVILDLLTEGIR